MLSHTALWTAIDRLAAREGISVSALAQRAGLDPTSFNISKRRLGKRPRWPSTESLMQLLRVTHTSVSAFVALATSDGKNSRRAALKVPFLQITPGPARHLALPELGDPNLRALKVTARHGGPYPPGTILLLRSQIKPRRNAITVLVTRTRKICIGMMRDQKDGGLLLAGHGMKTEKIAREDIVGCYTVVWTRQGPV